MPNSLIVLAIIRLPSENKLESVVWNDVSSKESIQNPIINKDTLDIAAKFFAIKWQIPSQAHPTA
jgi:hypothetical protein